MEAKMDVRVRMSTLWVVVLFNMAFADILSFITPGTLQGLMNGTAEGLPITQGLLLGFAMLLEIPIAMVFLSRLLKQAVNRWVNIVASVITMAFVVGGGSALLHYVFFAGIEIVCMLAIIVSAWKWRQE